MEEDFTIGEAEVNLNKDDVDDEVVVLVVVVGDVCLTVTSVTVTASVLVDV